MKSHVTIRGHGSEISVGGKNSHLRGGSMGDGFWGGGKFQLQGCGKITSFLLKTSPTNNILCYIDFIEGFKKMFEI